MLLLLPHEGSLNLLSGIELTCKIQISNKLHDTKDSTRESCRDLPLPVCEQELLYPWHTGNSTIQLLPDGFHDCKSDNLFRLFFLDVKSSSIILLLLYIPAYLKVKHIARNLQGSNTKVGY